MDALPAEIVEHSLSFLKWVDVVPARMVCRLWNSVARKPQREEVDYVYHVPNVTLLRWAKCNGCEITKDTLNEYAARGRRDLINCAFELGIKGGFDFNGIVAAAAGNNRKRILEWVSSITDVSEVRVISMAKTCNRSTIEAVDSMFGLNLLKAHSCALIEYAVKGNNVELLEAIIKPRHLGTQNNVYSLFSFAIESHSLDAFRWLYRQKAHVEEPLFQIRDWDEHELDYAYEGVNLDHINVYSEVGDSIEALLWEDAATLLDWLVKKRDDEFATELCQVIEDIGVVESETENWARRFLKNHQK